MQASTILHWFDYPADVRTADETTRRAAMEFTDWMADRYPDAAQIRSDARWMLGL